MKLLSAVLVSALTYAIFSPAYGAAPLNTLDRAAVVQFYNENHLGDAAGGVQWTGSYSPANQGTTSDTFKASELLRLNYYRGLAGTKPVTSDPALNDVAQAAAFLIGANGQLSHNPPDTWTAWTPKGADAVARSNLVLGYNGVAAVDAFITDEGANNAIAGHREWLLGNIISAVGLGDVPASGGKLAANAITVVDSAREWDLAPPRDGFIAWPNAGFVPYKDIAIRWSFQLPNLYSSTGYVLSGDSSDATVSATYAGASLATFVETRGGQMVFRVLLNGQPISRDTLTAGTINKPIRITISNYKFNGVSQNYTYTVVPFDPLATAPAAPVFSAPTSITARVGQAFNYQLNAPDAFLFTAQGLPQGLTLNSSTGVISGTPTTTGVFPVTLTASNGTPTSLARSIILQGPITASSARLVNISTRSGVGTGNDVLIAGIVISGSAPKKVIIRAAGPALVPLGVTGAIADPTLELYNSKGVKFLENDNWDSANTTDFVSVGAGAWAAGSKDAAIVTTLQPGLYTAIVRGKNETSGVGIIEVFEQDIANKASKLVNISSRSLVKTGDEVMIAGFVIDGSEPKTVIIRAGGPALAAHNINNYLPDPVLELYSKSVKILENDDWDSSDAIDFAAVGAAPWTEGTKDAALVVTLQPGAYTTIVRGKSGATGVALVEVYDR